MSKYKKNRKHKKRKYSVLKYGLLTVVASVALLGSIYSYFGGLGTGKCADMNITVRQSRQSGVARATCPD